MPKRTISVLVISFNHASFIGEALNSILSQQVDARVEIIVADDCSTDDTVLIVKEFQKRFSERIILLESQTNLGHTKNYARAWAQAKGDFIAHCDGDDFWTDPFKLAKQLAFLESHPDFSSCANKISVICDAKILEKSIPRTEQEVFTTEDLLEACYPHNSSLFFRNRLFDELPGFFFELTGHDWCISVLNSLHGPIRMFPETMSVWRIRSNGLWGGKGDSFHLEHTRLFLHHMMGFLPDLLKPIVKKYAVRNFFQLAEHYLKVKDNQKARFYFRRLCNFEAIKYLSFRPTLSLASRIYCLPVYHFFRQARNLTLGEPPAASSNS